MGRHRQVQSTSTVEYHTRSMLRSARDKLRVIAFARGESMEATLNVALTVGLAALEEECRRKATA